MINLREEAKRWKFRKKLSLYPCEKKKLPREAKEEREREKGKLFALLQTQFLTFATDERNYRSRDASSGCSKPNLKQGAP